MIDVKTWIAIWLALVLSGCMSHEQRLECKAAAAKCDQYLSECTATVDKCKKYLADGTDTLQACHNYMSFCDVRIQTCEAALDRLAPKGAP